MHFADTSLTLQKSEIITCSVVCLCNDPWRLGICLLPRFDEYAKKQFRKVNTRGTNSFEEIMTLLRFVCAAISGALTQLGHVGRSLSGTPIHPYLLRMLHLVAFGRLESFKPSLPSLIGKVELKVAGSGAKG